MTFKPLTFANVPESSLCLGRFFRVEKCNIIYNVKTNDRDQRKVNDVMWQDKRPGHAIYNFKSYCDILNRGIHYIKTKLNLKWTTASILSTKLLTSYSLLPRLLYKTSAYVHDVRDNLYLQSFPLAFTKSFFCFHFRSPTLLEIKSLKQDKITN